MKTLTSVNDIIHIHNHSRVEKLDSRKDLLIKRWDLITVRALRMDWGSIGMWTLASSLGFEWYCTRGNEPLADFLRLNGCLLLEQRGFGVSKFARLCEIVESAMKAEEENDYVDLKPIKISRELREVLKTWGIPQDFPCRLARLPVRLLNYCAKHNIAKIIDLLDLWEKIGFLGFKSQPNLGTKSVMILEVFVESLRQMDIKKASSFLPIASSGNGLSLGCALNLIAIDPKPSDKSILNRRLVERMTLEMSSEDGGLTRERVRQVEAKFLCEIAEVLEYFDENRIQLLDAWAGDSDWSQHVKLLALEKDEVLIVSAIEAVFRDTPQEVARVMCAEALLVNWYEELLSHHELWFGGVKFSEFLSERVPITKQQGFCEHILESSFLRLDHMTGQIHPTKTSLRQTVEAIIAAEIDPIPLTWLIELLVRTGYHPQSSLQDLKRQSQRWATYYSFPVKKILWDA